MVTILILALDTIPSIKASLPLKRPMSLTILRSHQLLTMLPELIASLLLMNLLLRSLTALLSHM
jgi:hypothetical protein